MSKNIQPCEDGKYRWAYEFSMMKNPVILLTVLKIFLLILLGMWLFFGLFGIKEHGFFMAFAVQAKELLIPAAILLVLSVVSYLILAGIYGWKYCVLFEMDENGIRHIQMDKQFEKAQAIGWLTAAGGALAGKAGTAGAGLLAAGKKEQYSDFSRVRHLRVLRAFHTIKLDAPFSHNQIYAGQEDFDFVLAYITEHIKSADKA